MLYNVTHANLNIITVIYSQESDETSFLNEILSLLARTKHITRMYPNHSQLICTANESEQGEGEVEKYEKRVE